MTCCVAGTGIRGLEQMVDNRMNHATRHATTHAKKNTRSNVQSSGILNVTRIGMFSLAPNEGVEKTDFAFSLSYRLTGCKRDLREIEVFL
jgi:hypothetical protein